MEGETVDAVDQPAELDSRLTHRSRLYYITPFTEITDAEYGALAAARQAFVHEHSELLANELHVGTSPDAKAAHVVHTAPMLPLVNVFTDEDVLQTAKRLGAVVESAVTARTTYVVAGENAGTKLQKAHKLGILALDEAAWYAMARL